MAGTSGASRPSAEGKKAGSKRGVWLILGGIVVAGVAAGYNWLRGLPKDKGEK